MNQPYISIVFLQGDEALPALEIYDVQGVDALFEYLCQWDYGDYGGQGYDESPAGDSDDVIEYRSKSGERYEINLNESLGYAGLYRVFEGVTMK